MTHDQGSETSSPQPNTQTSGARATPRPVTIPAPPSAEQFAAQRTTQWHQDDQPLLTTEALRAWLNRSGLVAYGPRVHQLGAPAPSWVEAILGKKLDTGAELGGTETARTLLTRLIADGSAVPLNLLGAAGAMGTDIPDYVASAGVFSYIFTLRGNKTWKQPPATSGAVKVSPLALATYEMLSAKVTLSAYDLATQLGKEVTETAVLRALTELWGQLRVLPVPQTDGPQAATLWELTTARFTKQIKAGANAGQPSALSALISLYLGQALAATEDEIETFLSPLAARSRVRDVIHALLSARQLETIVVEGKTLLHVAGELPAFASPSDAEEPQTSEGADVEESGSRIKKFAARPGSKIGTGLRSKSSGSKSAGRPPFGAKPAFGRKPEPGDRERRPFQRESKPGFARPRFDKPWNEDRRPRAEGESLAAGANGDGGAPARQAPRPRPEGGEAPRRTFSKPGTFGRKREGFGGKPASGSGEGRPPRREFGSGEGRPPRREFGSGEGRPPRREFGSGEGRPPRREFGSGEGRPPRREFGERPAAGGSKRASSSTGSYPPRPKRDFGEKPAFGAKPSFGRNRDAAGEGAQGEAPRKVFRKFDAPREGKPFRARPEGTGRSFEGKPAGARPARSSERPEGARGERPRTGFGAKPAGAKSFGNKSGGGGFAKAGGPFAKFADGAKPFRKPGAPRKPAGGGKPGGGFKPTKRRPEGNG